MLAVSDRQWQTVLSFSGSRPESADDGHSFIFSPVGEIQTVGERMK